MEADNLFRVPGPHQHPNSPSRRHRWGITRRHVRRADMARPTLLAGALPPSLRDLRPSLTVLDLYTNGIASVPTEIAPLTGLQDLTLALNLNGLTGFPMGTPHHVQDLRPSALLRLVQFVHRNVGYYENEDGFSCAKVGAGTSGCISDKCGPSTCYAG